MVPNLTVINYTSTKEATLGDIIVYELVCTNDTDVDFENIIFTDLLNQGIKFIEGSLEINSCIKQNSNVVSGVNIGNLKPSQNIAIKFSVQVFDKFSNTIITRPRFDYTYKLPYQNVAQNNTIFANPHKILIHKFSLSLSKRADKKFANFNDTINYDVSLINDSDIDLNDIKFFDVLPPSLTLIEGSLTINGMVVNNVNLEHGIYIGNLLKSNSVNISFSCIVSGNGSMGKLTSEAFAKYSYHPVGKSIVFDSTDKISTSVSILLLRSKQLNVSCYIKRDTYQNKILQINEISSTIDIKSYYVIKTHKVNCSGNKLIIHGVLNQAIQYTSDNEYNRVYSTYKSTLFSDSIDLPFDYAAGSKIDISSIVEHKQYDILNEEFYFINNIVSLNARIFS